MEFEDLFFILIVYIGFCWLTSDIVRNKESNNHYFWIFLVFTPFVGVFIAPLMDWRDKTLLEIKKLSKEQKNCSKK